MGQEVEVARAPTDEEVRALLKNLEWSGRQVIMSPDLVFSACPACHGTEYQTLYLWLRKGHRGDCPLDLAIRFWRVP
jgi:hypothetical protein